MSRSKPRDIPLPELSVSGSYRTMGERTGEKFKRTFKAQLADSKARFAKGPIAWDKAVSAAAAHLPYSEAYNPDYMDFVRGYAEGAGVDFEDVYLLLSEDEKAQCTDVLVNQDATADGHTYSAHTEDWRPASMGFVALVKFRPKTGPSFAFVTHSGVEWITGVNSAGLSVTGNSLYQNDTRLGTPKMLVAPKIMMAKDLSGAVAAAIDPTKGSSYNFNIAHASGEILCVEASATDYAIVYPTDGFLVHANFHVDPKMQRFETAFGPEGKRTIEGAPSTVIRYHRALKLMVHTVGNVTADGLESLMRDHVGHPNSICRHPDARLPEDDRSQTNYATLIDPAERTLKVCMGSPCQGRFVERVRL